MRQCPTCGSPVAANADVCTDCGMELPKDSSEATPPAQGFPPPVQNFTESASGNSAASDGSGPGSTIVLEPPQEAPPPVPAPVSAPTPVAPTAASPAASLTIKRNGALTTDKFALGSFVTIGRFDAESGPVDVDLGQLPEAVYVSRHHAEMRCDDSGQWLIKDLGSRNGTFVRSGGQGQFQRVSGEQPVRDGDEIALGNARFEFHTGA